MTRFIYFTNIVLLIFLQLSAEDPSQPSPTVSMSDSSNTTTKKIETPTPRAGQNGITNAPSSTLQFSCENGVVSHISGVDLKYVIVYEGGSYQHISDNNIKNLNKKTLHIMYNEKEQDEKIVAGNGTKYYELQCKSDFVVSATAKVNILSSPSPSYVTLSKTEQPLSISLSIMDEGGNVATAVNIGDKLTLQIVGPAQYIPIPINCTAFSGVEQEHYTLWTCTSHDKAIISDTWNVIGGKTATTISAFRFVDSATVTIECFAHLCPTGNQTCSDDSCLKSSARRRRREVVVNTKQTYYGRQKAATATFTVKDLFKSNGCAGFPAKFPLIISVMVAIVSLLRQL